MLLSFVDHSFFSKWAVLLGPEPTEVKVSLIIRYRLDWKMVWRNDSNKSFVRFPKWYLHKSGYGKASRRRFKERLKRIFQRFLSFFGHARFLIFFVLHSTQRKISGPLWCHSYLAVSKSALSSSLNSLISTHGITQNKRFSIKSRSLLWTIGNLVHSYAS